MNRIRDMDGVLSKSYVFWGQLDPQNGVQNLTHEKNGSTKKITVYWECIRKGMQITKKLDIEGSIYVTRWQNTKYTPQG